MPDISKLPFLISIVLAIITALSGLYNGKSFDIIAKETCIVIVAAFAFGMLIRYALEALMQDVVKNMLVRINTQKKAARQKQNEAAGDTENKT